MADKTIGENIKTFREARGLSQSELAELIGKKQGTICNWELGRRDPGTDNLKKLAAVLDIPTSEIVGHNQSVITDSKFEIVCTDIAMRPEIRPGDRLVISKAIKPVHGDFVVAMGKEHRGLRVDPVVRIFVTVGDLQFLLPADKNFPCQSVDDFDLLGKVTEICRRV